MMILLFGGRDFFDENAAADVMNKAFEVLGLSHDDKDITFIHGAAKGADTVLSNIVSYGGFKAHPMAAQWDDLIETPDNPVRVKINSRGYKYNVLAGMNRNTKMVNVCDTAIGVWDGVSPGTKDSRDKVSRQGKPLLMFDYEGKLVETYNI